MSDEVYVDYELLHTCQYPVDLVSRPDMEVDCGRPAPYRVWWVHESGLDSEMFVCAKHLEFILKCEKKP